VFNVRSKNSIAHKRSIVLPELVCYKICVMSSITKNSKYVEREARLFKCAQRTIIYSFMSTKVRARRFQLTLRLLQAFIESINLLQL